MIRLGRTLPQRVWSRLYPCRLIHTAASARTARFWPAEARTRKTGRPASASASASAMRPRRSPLLHRHTCNFALNGLPPVLGAWTVTIGFSRDLLDSCSSRRPRGLSCTERGSSITFPDATGESQVVSVGRRSHRWRQGHVGIVVMAATVPVTRARPNSERAPPQTRAATKTSHTTATSLVTANKTKPP